MPIRLLEDRIQSGTTPSLGYADRYPKVDMPASVLEAQRANQNISSPSGMKLPGAYELMATAASPAINFAKGLMGFQNPFLTQTMQDRMAELSKSKGTTSGSIGYEDYGLPASAGRFTGGLFDLALKNPVDFGLAGSVGRFGFNPQGYTDTKYDFTPDPDTGSTGSAMLDFINEGGVRGKLADLNIMGTAQAGEATPDEIEWQNRMVQNQRFKQQQLMNRRKQQMQQRIRQAEAAEAAKKKVTTQKKITTGGPTEIKSYDPSIKKTGPTYGPHKKTKVKAKHSPHGGGPGGYTPPKYKPPQQTGGGGGVHSGMKTTSSRRHTGHGKSGMGRDRSELMAKGGLINLFKNGGFLG